MRQILKNILKQAYFGVKKISDSLVMLLSVLLFSRNLPFDWKRNGTSSAVIVGNGPSLANDIPTLVDRREKENFHIWVVNYFCFSEYFIALKPEFYVLADPIYWTPEPNPELKARRDRLLSIMNEQVNWSMTLFLPLAAQGSDTVQNISSNFIKVKYYNNTPVSGSRRLSRFFFQRGLAMPLPMNVLIATLSLALHCPYRRIYLLGADHSWHEELRVSDDNQTLLSEFHFYPEKVTAKPSYRADMSTWKISDFFLCLVKAFKGYEWLREYADSMNVDVVNASSKSYIDAFERMSLERAVFD